VRPEPCSAFGIDEGEKGDNPGPFHGIGEVTLLLGSETSHATGQDLAALGDEFFKEINVLVVDWIARLDRGKTLFKEGAGHAKGFSELRIGGDEVAAVQEDDAQNDARNHLISLWAVDLLQWVQNFFSSSRSVVFRRFFSVV